MESNRLPARATYADYITWNDDFRYEIVDFVPYLVAAPSVEHQRIVGRLFRKIADRLDGSPCEPFVSPFDVRLADRHAPHHQVGHVLQPDITVICDHSGLDDKGYSGVPALIIEVVSPSSAKMDRWLKYNAYQQHGVPEYWIVIPAEQLIEVHVLEHGTYRRQAVYGIDETAVSRQIPGLAIPMSSIF
ncbi:Uma2 family endonuclease [Paenibacillus chartarius]|uniref:Uma2 family endonuclease n=1 Tax=Paenibacillus chartarius TaxID=747481 RepID=A0ABV6DFK0_9BACL